MSVNIAVIMFFVFTSVEESVSSLNFRTVNNTMDLADCVSKVLYKYHEYKSDLTLFDMNTDGEEMQGIMKAANTMIHLRVVLKNLSGMRPTAVNVAYMILADSSEIFVEHFYVLQRDKEWNPMARFYVIIQSIDMPIEFVFKKLLFYHVNNIIIIDGQLNIFTYFPFANGACGRRFDEVHKISHCLAPDQPNLFPDKLINGLQNCTFRVLGTHFPPYVIDTSKKSTNHHLGSEQCTLEMLAKLEKFKLKYEFSDIVDEFSTVNEDMEAVGPMRLLQNNVFDILMGGMFLIENRARPFAYLYGQTAYLDEIRIFARVADKLPDWKIFYIEFDSIVWVLIIVSFIIYSGVCIVMIRNGRLKDRCSVILKLWDNLFLHEGIKLHVGLSTRCVFIIWLWFTFLLNSYYQTSLTSFTTTTVNEYQVKSMEDLRKYNYKSCVSPVVQNYMSVSIENHARTNQSDCQGMLSALMVVNRGYKLYTISPLSVYEADQTKFVNEEGKSSLYVFPTPLNKLLTALFFYKGFPNNEKFLRHTLIMTETGQIAHCLRKLLSFTNVKINKMRKSGLNPYTKYVVELDSLLVPYAILGIGIALSSIAFCFEVFVYKYKMNKLRK